MHSLQDINGANARAQANHFRAAYLRALRTSPDGFTLDTCGARITRGDFFAVAVDTVESVDVLIRRNLPHILTGARDVYAFINGQNFGRLAFGYWHDGARGYFESVALVPSRRDALALGVLLGERAVYDFARGVCVDVATGRDIKAAEPSDARKAYFGSPILGARRERAAPVTLTHAVTCDADTSHAATVARFARGFCDVCGARYI
jgi:hypothetical protein